MSGVSSVAGYLAGNKSWNGFGMAESLVRHSKPSRLEQAGHELRVVRTFYQEKNGVRWHGLTEIEAAFIAHGVNAFASKAVGGGRRSVCWQVVGNQLTNVIADTC